MSAVFKKEFSQLFHSMIGYVCLAVFAAITGYYFFTLNLLAASGDVRGYFSSVANVIMLILPMLTMRSFSEEKKMRTDQLLIASPVSSFAIVMGKALATACFFIVCLLPCAAHMLWLFRFCNADLRLIACCAIGLLLTASAFLSIGLYLSAVTENQVMAFCWLSGSSAMPAPMFPSIGFGSFCMPLRCSTDTAASPWAFSPFRM